jgi:hypothetical protein
MSKLGCAIRISDSDAQDAAKWVRRRRTRKRLRRASPLRQLAMLRGEVQHAGMATVAQSGTDGSCGRGGEKGVGYGGSFPGEGG